MQASVEKYGIEPIAIIINRNADSRLASGQADRRRGVQTPTGL
jgi:hypothetical protein